MSSNEKLSSTPLTTFDPPRRLHRLVDLAYNLWWTWGRDAVDVFKRIDQETWEATRHNPVSFLQRVPRERLVDASQDQLYLDLYDRVIQSFDHYMRGGKNTWYSRHYPEHIGHSTAYFCSEYGLHESLPIFSGGLGVLSGDYLKEASDLGIPLVAVGLLYKQGFFIQRITEDGRQEAHYADLSYSNLPIVPVLDDQNKELIIDVDLSRRVIHVRVWRIQVGRVPLFLLDANLETNKPKDRALTAQLYPSDQDARISQEIILGIGGVRALRALGYNPTMWHLNEGHSAFLTLERIREQVANGKTFEEAVDEIIGSTVFTTHTPVPAGQEEFPIPLVENYFSAFWSQLNLERETFLDLAHNTQPWGDTFSLVVLAMRMSGRRNGVSELHGNVARKMWSHLWPDIPVSEVPILHITNGIHTRAWIAPSVQDLFDKYLEPNWMEHLDDFDAWEGIDNIPDKEFWEVRAQLKRKLVAYIHDLARQKQIPGNDYQARVITSSLQLDPNVLTIGFARRFTTYKRSNLILRDPERLLELINNPDKPVQVIFAGKAHPADEPGQRLIQEVHRQVKRTANNGRLVFLEEYDI
ncbi:MAG: alpha-glucan family phosphorylase, partial [Anaerolineales bacterium]|nr:alpha-glucan family phosphorylase [Anaerolineales bacterium]